MSDQLETRIASLFDEATAKVELRVGEGEVPHRFVGVIPFNALSADLGGFRERITPTAFRSTLSTGADVLALCDHSREKLLGRTSNGTLRLAESPKGLEVTIDLPDTSYARDMRELVKRHDIRGLSFGFRVREGGQKFIREGGQTIRDLLDIDLREVSLVSQPAYPDTAVALRSLSAATAPENLRPVLSRCNTQLRHLLVESLA